MASTAPYCLSLATFVVLYFAVSARAHSFGTLRFTKETETACPDGSACDDTSTCCQIDGGGYGCCPYKKAVCCADNVHCCPFGMTCDVERQQCSFSSAYQVISANQTNVRRASSSSSAAADPKDVVPEVKKIADAGNMVCPDRATCELPHSACCRRTSGYVCCNYPNNVCCDGGNHCCPVGTVCDPVHFTCIASPTNVDSASYGWAKSVIQPNFSPTRSSAAAAANKDDV